MKNRISLSIIFIVLGVLIAVGPLFIFPVCTLGGKDMMKCGYTARAELGIGAIITILGIGYYFLKSIPARFTASFAILLNGIVALLIPTVLIGVCDMHTMHCHMITLPSLVALSILTIIGSAGNGVYQGYLAKKSSVRV